MSRRLPEVLGLAVGATSTTDEKPLIRFGFTIPFVPAALKNRPRLGRIRRRGRLVANIRPSKEAEIDKRELRALLRREIGGAGIREPMLGDRDVAVSIVHRVREGLVDVTVEDRGPRPKGFTGRKRDLHNIAELVLDAMQEDRRRMYGGLYRNDNQVVELTMRRER